MSESAVDDWDLDEPPTEAPEAEWAGRPPPGPWVAFGACRGKPIEWWFPTASDPAAYAMAEIVCNDCNVQPQCLLYALEVNETHGMWGGRTERARARIRRQTGRTA